MWRSDVTQMTDRYSTLPRLRCAFRVGCPLDRLLRPLHHWVWGDFDRRVRKLLAFGEVEADGGRDILRAAEVTPDPLLRRLYLEHAIDELHHGICSASAARRCCARVPPAEDAASTATRFPAATASTISRRRRTRPSPARVPARRGEGGGRPIRDLSRARRRRSATRAIFEEILRDEVLPHELHLHAARAHLAARRTAGTCGARASRLWKRYLRVAAAVAGLFGSVMLTLMYFVVLPPVRVARQARRAARAGRLDADRARAHRVADEPVLRCSVLGISAHYHDSAAALVVDGVPVCAVQEERLSRRKNDATLSDRRHRMVPRSRRARARRSRRRRLLRAQHAEVRADPHLRAAAFPRSWRSFPHAIKNSLGEKVWVRGIIASHLGVPRTKILFTRHHAAHAAAAFLTAPTGAPRS